MTEIKTIAVIGAGTMGRGIAQVASLGGYRTILEDILPTSLAKAEKEIRGKLEEDVALGTVEKGHADEALSRLEFATSMEEAARAADLVIEAAPEEFDSKEEIFRLLDRICRPGTLIATHTSNLSISEIAAVSVHPENVVGMHFFYPVHKIKLVEIVRARQTSDATLSAALEVGRRMGKEAVVINEAPGFIVGRMNALIQNEAFHMLEAGLASAEDIDRSLKHGLNHRIGPFEAVDALGLDTRLTILKDLQSAFGEKFRPAPLLEKFVQDGRLGKKVGRGVYDYPDILAKYEK